MAGERSSKLEALERSAVREINEELVTTHRDLGELTSRFVKDDGLQNSRYVVATRELLLGEMRRIAGMVLHRFTVSALEPSQDFGDALRRALTVLHHKVVTIYDGRISSGFAQMVGMATPREAFVEEGRGVVEGRCEDFTSGIAHDRARAQRQGVTIQGVTGNVAVAQHSPGAQTQAGSHQQQYIGWDSTPLLQALLALRAKVGELDLEANKREELVDSIVNLEREAKEPLPEPTRLRRLAHKLRGLAAELPFAIVADIVASKILPLLPQI